MDNVLKPKEPKLENTTTSTPNFSSPKLPKQSSISAPKQAQPKTETDLVRQKIMKQGFAPKGWKKGDPVSDEYIKTLENKTNHDYGHFNQFQRMNDNRFTSDDDFKFGDYLSQLSPEERQTELDYMLDYNGHSQVPKQHKQIMNMFFVKGKNYSEIAKVFGLSSNRISEIIDKNIARIRNSNKKLENDGTLPQTMAQDKFIEDLHKKHPYIYR